MRWTRFFIPTARQTPAEAVVPSHRLLLRAGLVRPVSAGAFVYLPLGYRVLRKIEQIIREEVNAAGAIELHMPAMHPIELWAETHRVEAMAPTLIHLKDKPFRRGTVLGSTHEAVITDVARALLDSYKQLPIVFYQVQTRFRDEERPKGGLLRTREFLMQDAYSFDADKAGLDASYEKVCTAYGRIFKRCGLPCVVVEAEGEIIGGGTSHAFLVEADAGEDVLVRSEDGTSAAHLERAAVGPLPETGAPTTAPFAEVHTPDMTTIEQVSGFLQCDPKQMIKTIIFDAGGRPLVALVRGDHEVSESKLARVAGVTGLIPAGPEMIRRLTNADVGFAGPVGLEARIICDQAVSVLHDGVTGANKTNYHLIHVEPGRDFALQEVADVRKVVQGDRAANGSALVFKKGIRVGRAAKLGTRYTAAMKATFLDESGKAHPLHMGAYAIGVSRLMAAVIETHHDEAGIQFPMSVAPFHVLIEALDVREPAVMDAADRLHEELIAQGVEVLLDDRNIRPGPKFKDADLIGIPIRVTVGRKGLEDGMVEVKHRTGNTVEKVSPGQVASRIADRVRSALAGPAD